MARLRAPSMVVLVVAGLLALLPFPGCGTEGGESDQLNVVATIGMIGDVVARIAGERATVETLMGPGVDPHLYKASEGDVQTLSRARVIFYNGLNLEGKMGDILVKVSRSRRVVAVTDSVDPAQLREPPEFQGHYDPHIWFDCSLWAQTLPAIEAALAEEDPDHAAEYRERTEALGREILELDRWVEEQIGTIPEGQRVLVTAHDAFGYFGRRYGMEVVGLQGISTVSEAGVQDVERVVDLIVERRIRAIFVESSVPERTIQAVQKACQEKGHRVEIGGTLFSDAMGAAGTEEGTYPGMVRHNVRTIVEALR